MKPGTTIRVMLGLATLVLASALVSCSHNSGAARTRSRTTLAAPHMPASPVADNTARYASLAPIGEFTIGHRDYDIGQVAISQSSQLIAVKASGASDWIEIHRIPSGKLVASFAGQGFSLHDFNWHPRIDSLAFAGGRASDARTATPYDGVYYVLGGQSGRLTAKIPVPSGLSDPVVWTPDGRYLVTTKGSWVGGDLVDAASRRVKPSGFDNVPSLHLAMSPKWMLAAERSRVYEDRKRRIQDDGAITESLAYDFFRFVS